LGRRYIPTLIMTHLSNLQGIFEPGPARITKNALWFMLYGLSWDVFNSSSFSRNIDHLEAKLWPTSVHSDLYLSKTTSYDVNRFPNVGKPRVLFTNTAHKCAIAFCQLGIMSCQYWISTQIPPQRILRSVVHAISS